MFRSIYLKYVQEYISEICSGVYIWNMFRSIHLKYVQEYISEICLGVYIWNMFRSIYLHLCWKPVWGRWRKQTRTKLWRWVLCWSWHDRDGGEEKGQIMNRTTLFMDRTTLFMNRTTLFMNRTTLFMDRTTLFSFSFTKKRDSRF